MTASFEYFPFDTGLGANSDELRWGAMMQWMRTTGIVTANLTLDPASDDLAVTANSTLGVQVAIGIAWIQGFYFEQSDDYYAVGVTPNTSGLDRIDLLTVQLDLVNNTIEYFVVVGTPAMSPVVPTPQQDADIWQLPLAEIYVADGAVTILSGDITDVRVRSMQGDGGSSAVTLTSGTGDESLVSDGVGPDLEIKALTAGTNITLTSDGEQVTIEATGAGSSVTLANAGTTSLVNDGVGPALATKGLVAGTDISFSTSATDVTINSTAGAGVSLTNAGTTSLVNDGVGPALATKGLVAGTGVSFSTSATDVTIDTTGSNITLANAGTTSLVNDGTGPSLATKGLVAGTNVTFGTSATDVTINADTVTLSSAGGTETLVNDGTGQALATKGLTAGTGISLSGAATAVTITNSDPASGVTLTSAGGTETLVNDGTGPSLATKGITAGTGISLSSTATALTVTNSDTGSAVTLTNAGTTSLVNDGVGPALANKGLVAGTNISFSTSATDVTITGANTPSNQPICVLRRNSDQAVSSGATASITWTTSVYDPYSMWNGTTGIVVPETGWYEISLNIRWSSSVSANGSLTAYSLINGATVGALSCVMVVGSEQISNNFSALNSLTSSDVVSFQVTNSSGVSLNVSALGTYSPTVSVIKIRS